VSGLEQIGLALDAYQTADAFPLRDGGGFWNGPYGGGTKLDPIAAPAIDCRAFALSRPRLCPSGQVIMQAGLVAFDLDEGLVAGLPDELKRFFDNVARPA